MPLEPGNFVPVALTLVALPLAVALAPRGRHRRVVAGVTAASAATYAGLLLLYVSITLCWALVGLGAVILSATGESRPGPRTAVTAAAAVALGFAFEATPGDAGILVYVAGAGPLLLAWALGGALADDARFAPRRVSVAAFFVLFSVTLIPFTSFVPAFLASFELVHWPATVLAIGGTVWYARHGHRAVDAARAAAADVDSVASYVTRPRPATPTVLTAVAFVVTAVTSASVLADRGVYVALTVAAAAGVVLTATRRHAWPLALGAVIAATVLAAQSALDLHHRDIAGATWRLAAATAAFTLATAAWLRAEATRRDAAMRAAATVAPASLEDVARFACVTTVTAPPSPTALAAARDAAAAAHRAVAVVAWRPRGDDPFATVPDDAYAWLTTQGATNVRVHVAVLEGAVASFVPPVVPEEADA